MTNPPTLLPARRPDLVAWRVGNSGRYLVRSRSTGESFQLGPEEHFLLDLLDGQQTGCDICRAFQERFREALSEEELDEFVELAARRGLLQDGRESGVRIEYAVPGTLERGGATPLEPARRPPWKRLASRCLKGVSACLRLPARILSAAVARLDMLRLKHLDFVPRPDDIFIVTYPRSGTTWMQMILYQLTSDGRMDFPHIAEYCPWFEKSSRSRMAFETRPSPRIFKSHLPYRQIPKGPGKYIYVARDGKDVAVSYYHLCRSYTGLESSFGEFFDRYLCGKVHSGSWFEHVRGWWSHRNDPNVLFLTYEELTRDLEGCIRRIADFCGFEVTPERLPGIVERCRFPFMKAHEGRFDPAMETLWEQGVKVNSFLRNGRVGDGTIQLSREQQARFDGVLRRKWRRAGLAWPLENPTPG